MENASGTTAQPLLVVWDLHGVLVTGRPANQDAFARTVGLAPDVWHGVRGRYCGIEGAWDQVERGRLTLEEFGEELSRRINVAGGQCTPAVATFLWGKPSSFHASRPRPRLLRALHDTPAHVHNAIGTNNVRAWRPHWEPLLDVSRFEWIFDSSELGCRKPERGFWRNIEQRSGICGTAVVLVDDRLPNVEAARLHGWSAIHFRHTRQCLADLQSWVSTQTRRTL